MLYMEKKKHIRKLKIGIKGRLIMNLRIMMRRLNKRNLYYYCCHSYWLAVSLIKRFPISECGCERGRTTENCMMPRSCPRIC